MAPEISIQGKKFGKLTATVRTSALGDPHVRYKCACECGGTVNVLKERLLKGLKVDCGCATPRRKRP